MIKAVLLDLDNTLLINPDRAFAVAYLRIIDEFFEQRLNLLHISTYLRETMQSLTGQRKLTQTNLELLLETVAAGSSITTENINATFKAFYDETYPFLRNCVQPVDIAYQLFDYLKAEQFAVVIATNPIYHKDAILQRLAWAGLPSSAEAYALVTHNENMHFAKPDPAYYAEILARIGIEPDEAIMVGDSIKNDITPADSVGLYTYQVIENNQATAFSGTLQNFYEALTDNQWRDSLPVRQLQPKMLEPQLQGNIGALFGLLAGVQDHFWTQHPNPKEWSILQILCHLLTSERTLQRPRLERILAMHNPFLAESVPPPGPESPPCDTDGYRVAREFVTERQMTIALLHSTAPADWMRPARHGSVGPTTLLEMAFFTVHHDRLHLNQLNQTMGKCE